MLPVLLLVTALSPAPDLERVRQDLWLRLNEERERAGAPPLRLVPALNQVAQQQAEEAGRRSQRSADVIQTHLFQVGYTAHTWSESFITSWADAREVVRGVSPAFRDVGIGIAEFRGMPLYTILFGWHRGDHFARETAGLHDLESVRAEMLARVNAARRSAGLPPLERSLDLDLAAQAHARDLLARGYYSHRSPEGSTPASRARVAGYPSDLVAENLHERAGPVELILRDWLSSPGHRRNVLDPGATELGVGLALGPGYGSDPSGYRVVWVQSFGRRAGAVRLAP